MDHVATSPTNGQPSVKNGVVNGQAHKIKDQLNQKPLTVNNTAAPVASPSFNIPSDFQIHDVDGNLGATDKPPSNSLKSAPSPPLGVLVSNYVFISLLKSASLPVQHNTDSMFQSNFKGTFAGSGFNLIFRPNSGPPSTTTFPNPVSPAPPAVPNENVLELNLTKETLSFSTPLGTVPNRGLQKQNDIFLNGVPYIQSISDVTNPSTGKPDGVPAPIHFEPGLWMHVPPTTDDPTLSESLVRMASIPHGTTINAQALAPTSSTPGPPTIPPVSITPFPIGGGAPIPFVAQNASNTTTPRLPQDLTKFIAAGTITQAILTDPNTVLRTALTTQNQKITNTITFTVSTSPQAPELGGGTANIAFLQGGASASAPQTGPNASAVQMSATFWIETVEHSLVVPHFAPGDSPLHISPAGSGLVFEVTPPREIKVPETVVVHSTQIQYSQVVFLNFAGLTWPHVSVATLEPEGVLSVPDSVWG